MPRWIATICLIAACTTNLDQATSQHQSASEQAGAGATNLCWLRAEAVSEGRVLCSNGALTPSAIPVVGTLSSSAYAWHCDNDLEYRQTCERAQRAIRDQQTLAIHECRTGFTKAKCVDGLDVLPNN